MFAKRNYGFLMTINWSKKPFIVGFFYSLTISILLYFLHWDLTLPWQPISLIGIAVAFYLGFKNNSSYDRTWEARKIWGGIVNTSRSFSAGVVSFIQGENEDHIKKEIIYRHIAWLTALRHQLRTSRDWEHKVNQLNRQNLPVAPEHRSKNWKEDLAQYLNKSDLEALKDSSNYATQILGIQSKKLQELRNSNYFDDFRHMEFHHHITNLYTEQGKAERIKNFPFPRQYASTALWLTIVFSAFVPFGLADIFKNYSFYMYWFTPFFSALVIWVFFLMEKIGDYSENPFEGTYNDVPITSIARGIEIDMREMINDTDIPKPLATENGFLM